MKFALIAFALIFTPNLQAELIEYKPLFVDVKATDRIQLRNFHGNIRLLGSESTSGQMTIKVKQENPVTATKESFDEWSFTVQKRDDVIELIVQSPSSKIAWNQLMISGAVPVFTIEVNSPSVPVDVAVRKGGIRALNWKAVMNLLALDGDVVVQGGDGDLNVSGQEGAIQIQDRVGKVVATTYSGKLKIEKIQGKLEVENFNGDSDLSAIDGQIQLETSRGNSKISSSQGQIDFTNGRGQLKIDKFRGGIKGQSGQGSVLAEILGEADVRITAKEGGVAVSSNDNGAYLNLGTSDGSLAVPNYLSISQTPSLKLVQGRMRGSQKGQIYIRTETGLIRVK